MLAASVRRTFALLFAAALAALAGDAFARGGKEPDPIEIQFDLQYGSPDPVARAKVIDSLKSAPDPLKFTILSTRVVGREKRADVISRVVDVLGGIKDEKTATSVAVAAKTAPPEARVVYVESLGGLVSSTAAHQMLLELVKDKDAYVRGMAAAGLGEHRAMDAMDPLLELLEDKSWMVQAAALAALPHLSDREAVKKTVPKLIEFLENVSGRMKVDAADALRRITGRSFGRDAALWREWYDSGMLDATPKPDAPADKPPEPKGAYANQDSEPQFYGMPVLSNRVVLVLDISLSMYDPIEIDKDRLRKETSRRKPVVTGEKKDDKDKAPEEDQGYDIPWWKVKTRLDLAKYQTINLVSQLRDDQSFEIITFSKEVTHWMGHIVQANSVNKQKAIAMLETVKPEDATNTWGAIAATFDMVDVNRKGEGLGPDEMYLVTDGAPSLGDIVDSNQIMEATLQLCKVKPLRINVIGIGVDLNFLRKLARDTGGQSKFFK
jgi:hypothetical protein